MTNRDDPPARLVDAWVAWDDRPRDPWTANERVDAEAEAARTVGVPSNVLRRQIAANRRAGMLGPEAVESAL